MTEPVTGSPAAGSRWRDRFGLIVLAVLAYLPALASSPGRMPADTKLYLYLDPGGLVSRSTSTFEAEQFAGWVPHQQITYLWPSGPWYWIFDTIGVPDWVAHRLWIGTIMFAAGAGARWAARQLGIGPVAALAGAALYQCSPYLLAYVSRTSLLLLPWAGLGWIVGLTIRATARSRLAARSEQAKHDDSDAAEPHPNDHEPDRDDTGDVEPHESSATGRPRWRDRLTPWREPALIALIVATVGNGNATALALIIPGPVLWLVHVAAARGIRWRAAAAIALRIGAACLVVSAWWVGMLVVQSRVGAPVLAYSETLRDVSRNSTGSEVLRGLGYWLFYQRDVAGPTTSASFDFLVSGRSIAISYFVALIGLVGLVVTRWSHRRFAALLVAVGALLAVGVHPIDGPSPLAALVVGDEESTLAVALRSSTRATPLLVLGLALGAAALVAALPGRVRGLGAGIGWRPIAAGAVVVLVVINLPSLWRAELVDPAIDRDSAPPAAWQRAADDLNASPEPSGGGRVLQLPGAEFGAFRWGYTVDQPLVALVDRPLVTRDLLPLGSGPAMDLLYALDDRFQAGWAEPETVAPVARLFGTDTIWAVNDAAFERFRTARPEVVSALLADPAAGLGTPRSFGEPIANRGEIATLDEIEIGNPLVGTALAPVELFSVEGVDGVVRGAGGAQMLSGSGDGIIDAAAAGMLVADAVIRYTLSLSGDELAAAIAEAGALVVTDSNRDRAHHWRGSQDVHGHTEPGGNTDDVLDPTAADQRLPPFDGSDSDQQTIAIQEGPVTAIASAYGEPFAYRPEDRAVMAIDGNPSTAWVVGDHGEPVGQRVRLTVDPDLDPAAAPTAISVRQVAPPRGGRVIDRITLTVDGADESQVDLDESSWSATGQQIATPPLLGGTQLEIRIDDVTIGDPARVASRDGVGFVEFDLGLGPTTEWIRPPIDGLEQLDESPVAFVLTRLRTDPLDVWRTDPEPDLQRQLQLPRTVDGDVELTVRADARASDDVLADLFGDGSTDRPASDSVAIANRRLAGSIAARGAAATDGNPTTAWITPFDGATGAALRIDGVAPMDEFLVRQPSGEFSTITRLVVGDDRDTAHVVDVPPADDAGVSVVTLPASVEGVVTVAIDAVEPATTIDRRYGDERTLPAAIAELSASAIGVRQPATDTAERIHWDCTRPALLDVDGSAVHVEFRADAAELAGGADAAATPCDPIELAAGTRRIASANRAATGVTVDRIVIDEPGVPVLDQPPPPEVMVTDDGTRRRIVEVGPCPDGCWLVLGEGYNTAWAASIDGERLDGPQLVDGGFNGWLLPPSTDAVTVTLRWTMQWPVTFGLAVSAVGVGIAAAVVLVTLRVPSVPFASRPRLVRSDAPRRRSRWRGPTLVAACALVISPLAGVAALAVWGLGVGRRWRRGFEVVGWLAASMTAVWVYWIERRDAPFPNAGWTTAFDHLNALALFAVVAIAVGAWFGPDDGRAPDPPR
ncbi:MAG: alpha-(1-_3)-arabinofuranosyltransferase family protein [Actinomycetota bacterium]